MNPRGRVSRGGVPERGVGLSDATESVAPLGRESTTGSRVRLPHAPTYLQRLLAVAEERYTPEDLAWYVLGLNHSVKPGEQRQGVLL